MREIKVFETSPRDGLQNEPAVVPLPVKRKLIELLIDAGLKDIEAGAFVSPKAVPQMADSIELLPDLIRDYPDINFHSLVPNCQGLEYAVKCGVTHYGLLTSCSEKFNRTNLNTDTKGSLARIKQILENAPAGSFSRIYLSMSFYSPWEGRTPEKVFVSTLEQLSLLNFKELVLSDTNGGAYPGDVIEKIKLSLEFFPAGRIACHFHDTGGNAMENIKTAADLGVLVFDSSAGGLGGCPYSPGATGNAATEDIIQLAKKEGWQTGIDSEKLTVASNFIQSHLRNSRV